MTEKATSEALGCGPEETASESAKAPSAEPSGETAASESAGGRVGSRTIGARPSGTGPHTPAATKPAPPNEGDKRRGRWRREAGREWQGMEGSGESSPPQASSSLPTSLPDIPSAPLLLAVEDVSDSSVTMSWEPPERLGRLGLQGYVLELCREGASEGVPTNARPMMVTQPTNRAEPGSGRPILPACGCSELTSCARAACPHPEDDRGPQDPRPLPSSSDLHPPGGRDRQSANPLPEKPGPPSSIRLLDVWGYDVALEWTPPQDPGNTELLGYVVQKADKKTGVLRPPLEW
uniref:Fibronectin type-III domain-containing protein n=1 Tax=Felis catus TaxID=9685 RepID=A0ABI7XJQ4_FELCA